MIVWITGKPGAGKTTTAKKLLRVMPHGTMFLDGDEVRQWLTPDCDFSTEGRKRHAQRVYDLAIRASNAVCAIIALPPGPVDRRSARAGAKAAVGWHGLYGTKQP